MVKKGLWLVDFYGNGFRTTNKNESAFEWLIFGATLILIVALRIFPGLPRPWIIK
jgi:hypothetical protein